MPPCEFCQTREIDVGRKVGWQEESRLWEPVFEFSLYARVGHADGELRLPGKVAAEEWAAACTEPECELAGRTFEK